MTKIFYINYKGYTIFKDENGNFSCEDLPLEDFGTIEEIENKLDKLIEKDKPKPKDIGLG